jgi:protein SCO1/2
MTFSLYTRGVSLWPTIGRRRHLAGLLLLGLLAGCGTAPGTASSPVRIIGATPEFHGVWLDNQLPEPDVTLTDTAGKPFNLRQGTAGRLTLAYFGYTHCPDICPTTMADLSSALRKLTPADRNKIAVVFITTDPGRDTPEVVRSWLASFDTSFIGLTGDYSKIKTAAKTVGIGLEQPASKSGDYEVTHGAEVVAFDDTHRARLIFSSGTSPGDYATDLPKLLRRVSLSPSPAGAEGAAS